jgi:hypothetical protein
MHGAAVSSVRGGSRSGMGQEAPAALRAHAAARPPAPHIPAPQALLRLHAGRQTSRPAGDAAASPAAEVVRLFLDSPDLDGHPLGLHALCHAGAELG